MHRDEQSVWQAGSYSFLTPARTDGYKQNSRLPPLRSFSSHDCLTPSLLCVPLCLYSLHTRTLHCPSPTRPSLSIPIRWLRFSLSLSFSRGPCFFTCITDNYFHPSIICPVLFSFLTSVFSTLGQQPPLSCIHMFLCDTLLSTPTLVGSWMYLSAHLVSFPFQLLCLAPPLL